MCSGLLIWETFVHFKSLNRDLAAVVCLNIIIHSSLHPSNWDHNRKRTNHSMTLHSFIHSLALFSKGWIHWEANAFHSKSKYNRTKHFIEKSNTNIQRWYRHPMSFVCVSNLWTLSAILQCCCRNCVKKVVARVVDCYEITRGHHPFSKIFCPLHMTQVPSSVSKALQMLNIKM